MIPTTETYTAEPHALLMVPLDSMTAIFHRRSGITHIVADPVPQILNVIGSQTMSVEEMCQRLQTIFDVEGDDAAAIIGERVKEMARLGLLERQNV